MREITVEEAIRASGYAKNVLLADLDRGVLRSRLHKGQRLIRPGVLVYWMDWKCEHSPAEHNSLRVALDILEEMDAI